MANDFFNAAVDLPTGFFQNGIPAFTNTSFEVDPMSSAFYSGSVLDTGSSPAKPGAENPFSNAWLGGSLLLEGIGNAIRAYRGMDSAPGMAGSMVQQYVAQQREDDRLNKLLEKLSPKGTSDALTAAMVTPRLKTDNPLGSIGGSVSGSYS